MKQHSKSQIQKFQAPQSRPNKDHRPTSLAAMATIPTTMRPTSARGRIKPASRRTATVTADNTQTPQPSQAASFWDEIHKIRTNSFDCTDDSSISNSNTTNNNNKKKKIKWSFRSRKSHILDTKGHYAWERELNCYQLQKLPAEVFSKNTLEICMAFQEDDDDHDDDHNHDDKCVVRIRFGALEGLRGWISLDAEPIPTTHARDSDHWKFVAKHGQLPSVAALGKLGNDNDNNNNNNESLLSTSYDYAFTTLYKGGTDVVSGGKEQPSPYHHHHHYLEPNSTSFVPKHGVGENDLMVARDGSRQRVRVRKPICKCKSDGGRKPLVSSGQKETSTVPTKQQQQYCHLPAPQWVALENYKVDIEGMLQRATMKNPHRPFLFREDVDLWSDDLHDNGISWLKARCFVCAEGWACLLRNFIRVDGVLCRVIDTRYIHTFGSSTIYREHSWREGPWEPLVRAISRDPRIPSHLPINDSIAARFLPLKGTAMTEGLSLNRLALSPADAIQGDSKKQLFMIHDKNIEDAIPVPNSEVRDALGISFVLKRQGSNLETISSGERNGRSESLYLSSLWSKHYSYGKHIQDATILSVRVSPNPNDGGRLAIGDDRGMVNVWRLSTGEALWEFPVAPLSILKRLEQNPYFESARLWVDHLVWSADGCLVGAAAGRNAVLASSKGVLMSLESTSGTITGLAFLKNDLAVASYGEVCWLTSNERVPGPLKRKGAAVECMDISPNGDRVAVGYLDKTLRIFYMGEETGSTQTSSISSPLEPKLATKGSAMDWVGFNASVKAVRFNDTGQWLAAMGGSAILVICDTLNARSVPPTVCRTPGLTKADGEDGTCHRFERIEWSNNHDKIVLLAALDAQTRDIHLFRFSEKGSTNASLDAWPMQVFPVVTVSPSFSSPSPLVPIKFAFFGEKNDSMENHDANALSFFALDTVVGNTTDVSTLEQGFATKFSMSKSDGWQIDEREGKRNYAFTFRCVH